MHRNTFNYIKTFVIKCQTKYDKKNLGNSMGFMINDDRFLLGCLDHWEFGVDNTGNLLDIKNMEKIKVIFTYIMI